MTKPIKTIMIALLVIMITSCVSYRKEREKWRESQKTVNLSAIKIGMTSAEVQTALDKKPDNIVAAKKNPEINALVEVIQYTQWGYSQSSRSTQSRQASNGVVNVTDGATTSQSVFVPLQRYWLYFVNDKLDKWEIAVPDHSPQI